MRACPCGLNVTTLEQGESSGIVDQSARLIATRGLFFLERTKAIVASYLAGLIKGAIPPYYSYYRVDPSLVTVQQVVGFLYKAIKDPEWMKIQQTMDTFEALSISREVPQYLLWITTLATSQELNAVKSELVQYFELDKGKSIGSDLLKLAGIDVSSVGKYLVYGLVGYGIILALPALSRAGRALSSQHKS